MPHHDHHHLQRKRLSDPTLETDPWESSSPSSNSRERHHAFALGSKRDVDSPKAQPSTITTTTTTTKRCCLNVCSTGCFRLKLRFPAFAQMVGGGQRQAMHTVRAHSERKKNANLEQRRLELEDEVDNLLKMLDNEEKVRRVLESALQTSAGRSTLEIPTFLPQKTKELLAELVMVEGQITRLEREVSKIRLGLTEGQDLEAATKSGQHKYIRESIGQPAHHISAPAAPVRAVENTVVQKKPAVETKPMFFINQAIKGDYTVHAASGKRRPASLGGDAENKEGPWISGFEGKTIRKSGSLEKAIAPDPPPRQAPSNKLEHEQNISSKFSKEPPLLSSSSEKSNQILQPNKLSGRIMKCLICIFQRMMRTSRSMELEKSSLTGRSAHSSLNSRSFHLEISLNPKPSLTMQRETARQDPYGIFEIEGSILRDIGPYKNLVRFTSGSMDAKGLSSSMPLLRKLRALMNNLQEADPRFLTHQQKLAFWINMYNTCIMNGFLEHGLPSSPEKVLALRNKAVLIIGRHKLNALTIEHSILRQPSNTKDVRHLTRGFWKGEKDDKEDAVRIVYGLEKGEPNVAFALCNGSKSSPAVRIYTADGVDSELEKAKLEYLQASIVVTAARKLVVPKLLLWNMRDFASADESLVEWICSQLPTSGSLRKSMTECLRIQNGKNLTEILDVMPYEFGFQYLFFI